MTDRETAVHVIVPTWNRIGLLPRALDSALAQTRPAERITVVDDGSEDGTADMLAARYAAVPEVRVVRLDRTQGVAQARRHALDETLRWTAWLDADDAWDSRYLESQLETLARTPEADAVVAGARYVGAAGGLYATTRDRPDWRAPDSVSALCQGAFAHASSLVFATARALEVEPVGAGGGGNGNGVTLAWLFGMLQGDTHLVENLTLQLTVGAPDYGTDAPALSADTEDAALTAQEIRHAHAALCAACGHNEVDLLRRRARYLARHGRRREARAYFWRWWKAKPDSTKALFGLFRSLMPWP